jgi:hypothetical protein
MTPTYEAPDRFLRDYSKLSPQQRARFATAVHQMVEDLRGGRPFRLGLRIRRVQGTAGFWEMTWAPDGRATWECGPEVHTGEPRIRWRRIGTHDIFHHP